MPRPPHSGLVQRRVRPLAGIFLPLADLEGGVHAELSVHALLAGAEVAGRAAIRMYWN